MLSTKLPTAGSKWNFFPPGQSNYLEIYIHLLISTCVVMVGFQFCLAPHSCEGLIPSAVPGDVNFFMGCACPSLPSPRNRAPATAGTHAGEDRRTSSGHRVMSVTEQDGILRRVLPAADMCWFSSGYFRGVQVPQVVKLSISSPAANLLRKMLLLTSAK